MSTSESEYLHNRERCEAERERRYWERAHQQMLAEAYEEGYAEDLKLGRLVGEIEVLQEWLGLPVRDAEELFALSIEELEQLLSELNNQAFPQSHPPDTAANRETTS
jgi:flagellar biosynthesis/type III secretory pathway protein FliH